MADSSPSPTVDTPATDRPARKPARRRQRSVRVSVAIVLLVVATIAVALALPTGSFAPMAGSAVLALVLGWASARIVYNELLQSRREHAADRAAQAAAYRSVFTERATEQAAFTSAMTERLTQGDREVRELSGTLVQVEKRAADAEQRLRKEAERADELAARVDELSGQLDDLDTAPDDVATLFDEDLDTVVDLMSWEDKVTAAAAQDIRKHA